MPATSAEIIAEQILAKLAEKGNEGFRDEIQKRFCDQHNLRGQERREVVALVSRALTAKFWRHKRKGLHSGLTRAQIDADFALNPKTDLRHPLESRWRC